MNRSGNRRPPSRATSRPAPRPLPSSKARPQYQGHYRRTTEQGQQAQAWGLGMVAVGALVACVGGAIEHSQGGGVFIGGQSVPMMVIVGMVGVVGGFITICANQ